MPSDNLKIFFQKMEHVTEHTAQELGKKVQWVSKGEDWSAQVDEDWLQVFSDPVLHLIRNAIDHGIETEDERALQGKPAVATIEVSVDQKNGWWVLEIRDDGRGITPDIQQQIFQTGFSSRKKTTEISGRGVGLDVVKESMKKSAGKIEIETELNKGCLFRLMVPVKKTFSPES